MKNVISILLVLFPFVLCSCFIDELTGASDRIKKLENELEEQKKKSNSDLENQKIENEKLKRLIPKFVEPRTNDEAKAAYNSSLNRELSLGNSFWVEDKNGNLEFPSVDNEVGRVYRISHKKQIPNNVESVTRSSNVAYTKTGSTGNIVLNVTCTKDGKADLGLGISSIVGSRSVGQLIVGKTVYSGTLRVNDEKKKRALIDSVESEWESIDATDSNVRYYLVTDVNAYEYIIKSFDTISFGGSISAGVFNVNGHARAMYYTEEVVYKVYKKFAELPYYRVQKDQLPSSIRSAVPGLRQENVDLNDIAKVYLGENGSNALFEHIEQDAATFGEGSLEDFKSSESYKNLTDNEFAEKKDKKKLETILEVIKKEEDKSKRIFDKSFKKVELIKIP